jgi:hypothetical protein
MVATVQTGDAAGGDAAHPAHVSRGQEDVSLAVQDVQVQEGW